MDEELISKKDLLDLKNISYGQLYRWKRKLLIPDEWFIRKSTFTGQETFFPRDKILQRIDKIINMKEDLSLDDIAEKFSPELMKILLSGEELIKNNIVSSMVLDIYGSTHQVDLFSFDKLLYIYVLERFFQSGMVGLEEGKIILQNLEDDYNNYKDKNCDMIFIRKFGLATCFLTSSSEPIYLEKSAKLIGRQNINICIEELKLKVSLLS
ncbi:MAG TPA: YhbD family protein [Clostridiaceae bacterium]